MKHLLPFHIYESQTSSGLTPEQESFLNRHIEGTWSLNPTTGLVDIEGDLRFYSNTKLKSFFGVKFGNVTGNFNCYGNELQSLAGAPKKVDGDFDCHHNKLQSLEGSPQEVGGNFYCQKNQLQSLKGATQKVNGGFYCYDNPLQSLIGAPREVHGDFNCAGNQLQSLTGAPREVDGCFNCSGNLLQSLEGAPQKVGGDFNCVHNNLQSLAGAPLEGKGSFECDKFYIMRGEWNMEELVKILEYGRLSQKAMELILTLPILNPTYWNSKISENPESTILQLSKYWDDMPEKIRNSIRIPSNLRYDFENLLELVRSGIM